LTIWQFLQAFPVPRTGVKRWVRVQVSFQRKDCSWLFFQVEHNGVFLTYQEESWSLHFWDVFHGKVRAASSRDDCLDITKMSSLGIAKTIASFPFRYSKAEAKRFPASTLSAKRFNFHHPKKQI
jgi:hypothetical protein